MVTLVIGKRPNAKAQREQVHERKKKTTTIKHRVQKADSGDKQGYAFTKIEWRAYRLIGERTLLLPLWILGEAHLKRTKKLKQRIHTVSTTRSIVSEAR